MSCHNIGRGINSITTQIIEEYDAGNLGIEISKKLIRVSINGVNYCDGNEAEAVTDMRDCRCGKCLKKMKKGERIFSAYTTLDWDLITEDIQEQIAFPSFCLDCLKETFPNDWEKELEVIGDSQWCFVTKEWED